MSTSPIFSSVMLLALAVVPWQLAAQAPVASPASVSLSAPAFSTTAVSQAITITGTPGQSWRVQAVGGFWLRFLVTPTCPATVVDCTTTTAGSTTITVVLDPTGLIAFTYSGSITVTYPTGTLSTGILTIPVTFAVGGANTGAFTATPSALTFAATAFSGSQTQAVSLGSNTANSIFFAATSSAPWLTTSLGGSSTFAPATVNVNADPSTLAAGTYQGAVTFTPAGGPAAPITLPVTLTVTVSQQLVANPIAVSFSTASGLTPVPVSISVSSGANVPYTAAISYPGLAALRWLTSSVTSGQTGTSLVLSASGASTLATGDYAANVTISSAGLTPVNIPVVLNISSGTVAPRLTADVNPIAISVAPSSTGSRTLTLGTSTGAAVPFTVSSQYTSPQNPGVNWLGINNGSGNTPATLSVSATAGSLPPGTYTANLIISTTAAGFTTLVIPVTMTVTGNQIITYSPGALNFTYAGAGVAPANQGIQLGLSPATPAQPAAISAVYDVAGQSWLTVVLLSSTTGAIVNGSQIGVSVNPAGLANGTYTGKVRVQATGGAVSNALIDIPVVLVVSGVTGGGNPTVIFSPNQLAFTAALNGATLDQPLTLTTNIAPPVSYVLSSSVPWMTVLIGTGTTPGTAFVRVNPAGLAAGTYNGVVILSAVGAANNGATVPVSMTITASTQALLVNPPTLSFVAQANGTPPPSRNVSIISTGIASGYTVISNQSWLQGIAATASTPGAIAVYVNPAGLAAGTYSGTLTAFSGVASVSIPVTLEITNGALLRLSQQSSTFNVQTGQLLPSPRTILVNASSGVPSMSVSAATNSGGNWLLASPASIQTAGSFVVSLAGNIVATLAPGTYLGTVTVSAPGAPSAILNVTLNVSANALLTMSTTPVAFNAEVNGNSPAAQTRPVTSTSGAQLLSATVSPNTVWLTASVTPNVTPATVTISASPNGLSAGVYTGSITISSGSSGTVSIGANTLVIPVTLTVSPLLALNVNKPELIFGADVTSAQPQTLQVTSTSGSLTYSVATNVIDSPVQWLTASALTAVTPSILTVSVNPAQLASGTYSGTVTLTPQSAGGIPVVIPVTLIVTQSPLLQVTPGTLNFLQVRGGQVAAPQTVQVTSQQPVQFSFTPVVQSPAGANWLTVTQPSGQTNSSLQVGLNNTAAGLPAGNYVAVINVFTPNSPGSIPVTVNLTVVAQNTLVATPAAVNFTGRLGQANPAPQTTQVTSSAAGVPLPFNVTSDSPWLNATPLNATTPANLTISVNTAALPTNTPIIVGRLTLVPLTGGPSTTITVSFLVEPSPAPVVIALANSATFQPGSLSPGMLFTIVGTNLGPAQAVSGEVANGRFTTALAGVRVLFDGLPAAILFASNTQINAAVPYQLTGRAFAQMTVEYIGVASNTLAPRVTDSAPGIFTTDGRQAAALNADGTVNSAANPAPAGSIVVLYATGEGQTSPGGIDGEVVPATNLKKPLGIVRVRVNGTDVPASDILYAGSAPSLVAGLMQINFRLPAGIAANPATPVEIFVGAALSPAGTTIAVR